MPHLILEQIIPDGTAVLHGHYTFSTISDLFKKNDAPVVTWLRDPVERVISNYYFYLKRIRDGKVPHEQCRDQETVIEYARRRSIRNRISSSLDGILLKDIFFVGITECFSEDLKELAGMLRWDGVEPVHKNSNREFKSQFDPVSQEDREEIRRLNKEDVKLYNDALYLRRVRRAKRFLRRFFFHICFASRG